MVAAAYAVTFMYEQNNILKHSNVLTNDSTETTHAIIIVLYVNPLIRMQKKMKEIESEMKFTMRN